MTVLILALWAFGLAFLAILWLGVAMSLFEMVHGLFRRGVEMDPLSRAQASPGRTWRQGLLAGAIGYAVVLALFAALNVLKGESVFRTPALLGQALLGQEVGDAIEAGPVVIYNGLHLLAFLALGLGAAWLLSESERHPKIWYPGFVLLLVVFLHAIGIVLWLAAPAGPAIPSWSIVIASAVAGVAMAVYFVAARPETISFLHRADLEA
jgi:hypothetical protein